jgi:hypothetical protein
MVASAVGSWETQYRTGKFLALNSTTLKPLHFAIAPIGLLVLSPALNVGGFPTIEFFKLDIVGGKRTIEHANILVPPQWHPL